MITGCNTNIRHLDMVFHVQTEDSGRANPHIISHVYYGGTIIASRKQEYADAVASPDLDAEVRNRIEEQHKTMLKALLRGEFDEAIDQRLVRSEEGNKTSPETEPSIPVAAEPTDSISAEVTGSAGASSTANAIAASPADSAVHSTTDAATTGNRTKPQTDTKPKRRSKREPRVKTEKVALPGAESVFGENVDTQKPLDEVILEYLVEKARERSPDRRPPPKTRAKE